MAFGMKQWIAFTVVGLALVTAWRLPPESPEPQAENVRSAEAIRFEALQAEARTTGDVLFRMMWADSLSSLTLEEADEGVAVLSPGDGEAVADQRSRLAARIRGQINRREGEGRRMVFGYVLQPHSHRQSDGAYSARERTETYVGTRDGVDYCMQVRVVQAAYVTRTLAMRIAGTDRTLPVTDELGPCRFYLAYGFAGPRIQEWLERGGAEFAAEEGVEAGAGERRLGPPGRRWLLGASVLRGEGALGLSRCLAGLPSACGALFQAPDDLFLTAHQREVVRRSPVTSLGAASGYGRTLLDGEYVLADLEDEFGREAFADFWTSEEDVGDAFEAAFGVDAGSWMVRWLDREMGVDPPGPGLSRSASTGAVLTIMALLGVAYWRRRERRIVR